MALIFAGGDDGLSHLKGDLLYGSEMIEVQLLINMVKWMYERRIEVSGSGSENISYR